MLKKKHCLESLIEKANNQLVTVERLVGDLEFAQIQTNVYDALEAGNKAMKQINSLMSLEEVERIVEDTRESMMYQEVCVLTFADPYLH